MRTSGSDRTVDGKFGTFDGDAAAFNRAERMDGGDTAGRHWNVQV